MPAERRFANADADVCSALRFASTPRFVAQIGANFSSVIADRGYRSREAPLERRVRLYIFGPKRRVYEAIKRDPHRRSAVEPRIGRHKSERRMGRNLLAHAVGDAADAGLAAAGCNFSRLLA